MIYSKKITIDDHDLEFTLYSSSIRAFIEIKEPFSNESKLLEVTKTDLIKLSKTIKELLGSFRDGDKNQ